MFSATLSKLIQQIAREALSKKHHFIDFVPAKDHSPIHAHVPQYQTIVEPNQHIPHIMRLIAHSQLSSPGKSKVIVFLQITKQTQLFPTLIHELKSSVLPAKPPFSYL
jgi:ATP-dependent RNA helicase MSS116, mitochondrial